jgi:hypothetical protein
LITLSNGSARVISLTSWTPQLSHERGEPIY